MFLVLTGDLDWRREGTCREGRMPLCSCPPRGTAVVVVKATQFSLPDEHWSKEILST